MREQAGSTRRFDGDSRAGRFWSALGPARSLVRSFARCLARRSGGGRFLFRCFFLGGLLSVVFVHDAGHIGAGFAKWGMTAGVVHQQALFVNDIAGISGRALQVILRSTRTDSTEN